MSSSVEVDVFVDTEYEATVAPDVFGGIRIQVDGVRLNRYVDESSKQFEDWGPEYAGVRVYHDVCDSLSVARALFQDEVEVFERRELQLSELGQRFVFEPLTAETLRIAFRVTPATQRGETPVRPTSACGYPVRTAELVREIVGCCREFLDAADELGLSDDPCIVNLENNVTELETSLEA